MARGTNRLVNGRNVDLLKYRTQSDWELRDRVAAGSVLLRMVKFSLDIELRQLHIAKGVPEADLWPACVIRIVEGMPVFHPQPINVEPFAPRVCARLSSEVRSYAPTIWP